MMPAAVPYAVAVLLYRAVVSAADEYGATLESVLHLNRHAVYERLKLASVSNLGAERDQNDLLKVLLDKTRRDDQRPPPGRRNEVQ